MAVLQNSREQESYRYYTPSSGVSPTKNTKIVDSTPVTSDISKIIDGVLKFFTQAGQYNIFEFTGRLAAVLFESIIYDFEGYADIEAIDEEALQRNINFNTFDGVRNITTKYLGLIDGYHTWRLTGYKNDVYRVWHYSSKTQYYVSRAVIQESIDEVLAAIDRIDWSDWDIDPSEGGGISRLNLFRKIKSQAIAHGLWE